MKIFRIFLFIICLVFFAQLVFAEITGSTIDPSSIGVGARPLGMGNAFVAGSSDTSNIFINPAGLAGADSFKLNSMSATLIGDFNYVVLGGLYPFDFGTVGIGYVNVGTSGIPLTQLVGGFPVQIGDTNYYSSVLLFSYGSILDRFYKTDFSDKVSLGASLKLFMQGFSGGGSLVEKGNGTGMDADIGARYELNEWASLGLNLQNCLPASFGGKMTWQKNSIEESIPMVIKAGGAFKILGENALYPNDQQLVAMIDTDLHYSEKKPQLWHLGLEWSPVKVFSLRFGIDQNPAASQVENNLTGGIGIKYRGFTFDYAYHQYSNIEDNTTHFFSFGYIGEEEEKKEKLKLIESVIKPEPAPVSVNEEAARPIAIKTFADVPIGYFAKDAIEYFATLGIIDSFPDGNFRPEEPLSRAELCANLIKAKGYGISAPDTDPFPDVDKNHWAAKYIKKAAELKIVNGYSSGLFDPSKVINRTEAIVIFTRFAELKEEATDSSRIFSDIPASYWAAGTIYSADKAGWLDYLDGRNFEPNKAFTRAEAAKILSKTKLGKARIRELLSNLRPE